MDSYRLYSIGHSSQTQDEFLALLTMHGINCIVDVRSVPASKYAPQFNQEVLKGFLKRNGVQYLHFGDEFGARRTDSFGKDGQVNFELAVKTPNFQQGVARLMKGIEKGYRIALMCSEADPLECHRFSMVSRYFFDQGIDVQHILKDGGLASHSSLEKEMINQYLHARKYHLPEIDLLFGTYTEEEQRKDAYRLKNREMKLIEQMELHHSEKVASKQLTVVYNPPRTVMQFDSKTFRTENEALYAQYCKPHEKEASIVVRRTVQRASD